LTVTKLFGTGTMTSTLNLRYLLTQAATGAITARELSELVHCTRALAESYLNAHRRSILSICAFHGITERDLATDCIGEVFTTDDANRFTQIQKFQRTLEERGTTQTDFEVFLAYKALVIKIVSAQLARSYAQIDPAGAKILRNIKDAIKHTTTLQLRESMGGYLISVSQRDALDHLEAFPLSLLEHQLASTGSTHKEIPELLKTLSTILHRQHQYRRSIPLIDLVQIMKSLYGQPPPSEETTGVDLRSLENEELHPLRQRVMQAVNEKILSTYFLKQKITREEAEKLSRVLHSIIVDWFEAGISENSLFEQTRAHLGITAAEYHAVWRKRVEYLVRVARETIKNYLEENL
jgi:hypothetical protein